MRRYVVMFSSACCTGWCYAVSLTEVQLGRVRGRAARYNAAWLARGGDGSVAVVTLERALRRHALLNPDGARSEADLLAWFRKDGSGRRVTYRALLQAFARAAKNGAP